MSFKTDKRQACFKRNNFFLSKPGDANQLLPRVEERGEGTLRGPNSLDQRFKDGVPYFTNVLAASIRLCGPLVRWSTDAAKQVTRT